MWGILVSAFNRILGWLVSALTIKFAILTTLYAVIAWIADAVLSVIDISPLTGLQTLLNSMPPGLLYMLGVFRFDVGLPMLLGAMLAKFLIRRLPFIG